VSFRTSRRARIWRCPAEYWVQTWSLGFAKLRRCNYRCAAMRQTCPRSQDWRTFTFTLELLYEISTRAIHRWRSSKSHQRIHKR